MTSVCTQCPLATVVGDLLHLRGGPGERSGSPPRLLRWRVGRCGVCYGRSNKLMRCAVGDCDDIIGMLDSCITDEAAPDWGVACYAQHHNRYHCPVLPGSRPRPRIEIRGTHPGSGSDGSDSQSSGREGGQFRLFGRRYGQAVAGQHPTGESATGRRRGRSPRGRSSGPTGQSGSEPGSSGSRRRPGNAAERKAPAVGHRPQTQQHHSVLHVQDPGSPRANLHGVRLGLLSQSCTRTQP